MECVFSKHFQLTQSWGVPPAQQTYGGDRFILNGFQPANEFNYPFAASLLLGVGLRDNGKDTGAIYKACGVIRPIT